AFAAGAWSNAGGFSLVPASSIYAPDVRATLSASVLGGGAVAASSVVTFTATINNVGLMPAFPATTGGSGLSFTLAVPQTILPSAGCCLVNGSLVAATSNGTNTLVTAP